MKNWLTLSLITLVTGCSSRVEVSKPAKPVADSHPGHHEHGAPSNSAAGAHGRHANMPGHLSPPGKLIVGTDPSRPVAGSPTRLVLQIQDEDGTPIQKFAELHEKLVHLIVVRDGLDEFAHLHPVVDASGMITGEFTFPKSGRYRLYADHQPQGMPPGLAVGELVVGGDDAAAVPLVPDRAQEVTVGEIRARLTVTPGEEETVIGFHLRDAAGRSLSDLQPYLGAMGHLVLISADGSQYAHAHPLHEAKSAPDGIVEFAAHFPAPGIYKAWGQFLRNDSVTTIPFVLIHNGGKPPAHQEGH